jgi:hypothetical protein
MPTPLLSSRSLRHIRVRRSTSRGLCLPTTVRPQGLVTLSTVCPLRSPASFVSRQRRPWDSPFGAFPSRKASERFRSNEPTYRFAKPVMLPPEGKSQPDWPRFLGFHPPESPWQQNTCLAHPLLDAPLGFALPGYADEDLAEISPGLLSRASTPTKTGSVKPAPQSINRPPLGLDNQTRRRLTDKTTLVEFLRRYVPEH